MSGKVIDLSKTVYELCNNNPEIPSVLKELGFKDITNPGMLNTAGRFMTIPKGAAMKKIPIETIKESFINHGYKIKE
jgi:selenophosphate synthetase-related protein